MQYILWNNVEQKAFSIEKEGFNCVLIKGGERKFGDIR